MPPGASQDQFKADFIVELEVRFPIFFLRIPSALEIIIIIMVTHPRPGSGQNSSEASGIPFTRGSRQALEARVPGPWGFSV